jgi:hypothetical protein
VAAVLLDTGAPGWAADTDNDGVDDAVDACPGTVIPERIPTKALLPLHYALTDADTTFNTFKGQESSFTTAATAGCSCTQIIARSGLGPLASQFGCNQQVMRMFSAGVHAAPFDPGQQFPATGQMSCLGMLPVLPGGARVPAAQFKETSKLPLDFQRSLPYGYKGLRRMAIKVVAVWL